MFVFYFHAHYGFSDGNYVELDEYGFIVAENFARAAEKISKYYGDDLLSIEIQLMGDSGIVSVDNEAMAQDFKKAYLLTHYGTEGE